MTTCNMIGESFNSIVSNLLKKTIVSTQPKITLGRLTVSAAVTEKCVRGFERIRSYLFTTFNWTHWQGSQEVYLAGIPALRRRLIV